METLIKNLGFLLDLAVLVTFPVISAARAGNPTSRRIKWAAGTLLACFLTSSVAYVQTNSEGVGTIFAAIVGLLLAWWAAPEKKKQAQAAR